MEKFKSAIKRKVDLKLLRNVIFFLVLIALTYWLIFKDQDMNELFRLIKNANDVYLVIGLVVMFMFYLMEAINVRCLLRAFGDEISILSAIKYTLIGFFFSSVTPAATGGQPVEVYCMTKENVSGANATLAMLIQLCGYQISTIFLGIVCAIINHKILTGGLFWLFLLGLTINGFALFIMLICVFSKKLTKKLIDILIKIMRIFKVSNVEKRKEGIEDGLKKYNESSVFILNNKMEFVKAVLRVFVQICFYYSVPFCVYKAFGFNNYNYFQIFTMQSILYTTVSSLPLPGAIGVSETIFLKIFKPAFGYTLISGAMLLSRGITFYFYVVVSLVVVIYNSIKTKDIKGEIDKKVMEYEKYVTAHS